MPGIPSMSVSVNELCHRHIHIRVQVYPPSRRSRAPSARLLAISLSTHGCAAAESRRQPVEHAYVRVVNQLSAEPCKSDGRQSAQRPIKPKIERPKNRLTQTMEITSWWQTEK